MENLSHSLRRNKVTRMSSHANAAAKGIYDDVFGGPPKFGVPTTLSPRAEDYREIFGGFHTPRVSSIPVLDLPVVDEKEVRFDVRSSGFDYSEVFGGFQGLNFADGYEELFGLRRDGSAGCGSSDEAWTPEASESLSEESDHSASNQCPSNEDSHHLFDGNIEYNISYHRANPRSDVEITNGLRCTAEIHAVSGYSYLVDRINLCQMKEKPLKKTRSDNSNGRNDVSRRKDYGRINSCPSETFVTISEVSLRTEPSHLPPPSRPPPAASMGDTSGPVSSWKTGCAEGNGEGYCTSSPPFFDMEVDASSSAAAVASAAAMEEAMLKAQAQLRSAKELMVRKKEGQQNRERTGSTGELRDMGRKHLNEDIVLGTSRGQSSEMKCFTVEEPRDVLGMGRAVQDSLGGEKLQNQPKKHFAERVRGKESTYNEMFGSSEEAGHWKEATQFSEMVKADRSGAVFAWTKGQDLSENAGKREDRDKDRTIGWFEGQEKFNKMKASAERRVPDEECVADARNMGPKVAKEAGIENNIEIKEKAGQDTYLWEDAKKTNRKTHHDRKAVVKLNGSESSDDHGSLNDVLIEVAREFEVRQVMEHKKDGLKSKKSSRRMEAKEYVTEGHGKACDGNRPKEPFKREEKERRPESVTGFMGNEKRCPGLSSRQEEEENRPMGNLESAWDDVNERQENEWRIREALEREEKEKRMREVLDQQERKKLKEAQEREENERRVKANLELAENKRKQEAAAREEQERRLKVALEREENEKRLRKAREYAERKKLKEALECEENEKKLREACEQEDERRRKEAHEKEEKEKVLKEALEKEEKEKVLKALEKEEKEKMLKEALEQEEGEKRLNEAREKEKMRKRLEEAQEMEENERKLRETCNREYIEERIPDAKGREKSENCHQEASQYEEDGSNPQYSYSDERNNDQGEIDDASRDTFELEELDKWFKEAVDVEEADLLHEADKKVDCLNNDTENTQLDCPASGSEQSSDVTNASDDGGHLVGAESQGTGNELPVTENKDEESKTEDSMESPPLVDRPKQTNLETPKAFSQMSCESRHQEEKGCAREWGKTKENINKFEVCFGEDGKRVETQPPALNAQRTSQQSQNAAQEKETERLRREQERLRKIEEEREREREREKDRMAIDRATLEARERAYAEARERADRTTVERATAEARQRSLAEARERLEKACAEAREQSFLEKTSNDARIRAERAAVERAIAEARERAASRYNGMRQSSVPSDLRESQHRTAGSSSSTRSSYNVETSEGVEGESPQRCRARLERHRRTAERAAKALAEKSMRDLLAQREQAERNRLAEILDADVKRWSSGKEGNLRALLSTLQYILGPDSGWQPIPLTEVITSAAVKKAYRKATLCVHPDKLQQRGASIQQKYTCEKVFDLLKEAWNKFNSEER